MHLWAHFANGIVRSIPLDEKVDELGDYDMRMRRILMLHISVLGWWSSLNVLAGFGGFFCYGTYWYYFLVMGIVWGVINFAVTVGVLRHGLVRRFKTGKVWSRFDAQWHLEKIMLLNIGLDLSYVFFGMYLQARGCSLPPEKIALWQGFGANVVMQGIFLFCMDNYMHALHLKNFRKARSFMVQEASRKA
jgi:hypothetical protein